MVTIIANLRTVAARRLDGSNVVCRRNNTSNDKILKRLLVENDIGLVNNSTGLSPNKSVPITSLRSRATIATNNGSNIASHLIENDVKLNVQNNKAPLSKRRKSKPWPYCWMLKRTKTNVNEVKIKSNKKDTSKISNVKVQAEHSTRNIDMYGNKKKIELLKSHFRIINTKLWIPFNWVTVAFCYPNSTTNTVKNEIDSKKFKCSSIQWIKCCHSTVQLPLRMVEISEIDDTTQAASTNAKPADVVASSKQQPNGNKTELVQQSRANKCHYKNGPINWTTNKAISHEVQCEWHHKTIDGSKHIQCRQQ